MATMEEELRRAAEELGIGDDEISDYEAIGAFDVRDYEVGDDDDDNDDVGDDDDDNDDVGARRKRRAKTKKQAMRIMASYKRAMEKMRSQKIQVNTMSGQGNLATVVIPCTALVTLVAGAVGNLIFTAQDRVEIVDCLLDSFVAAAVAAAHAPGALAITAITVGTRNIFKGAGDMPIRAFYHDRQERNKPFLQWGALDNGQAVTIALVNRDAATAHNITGCLLGYGGV